MARLVPLLLLLLVFAACNDRSDDRSLPIVRTDIPMRADGTLTFSSPEGKALKEITIEIADDDQARQTGLMARRSLDVDHGMLFMFPKAEIQTFWMHNTPTPLDMIFVGADSVVTNVAARTTPLSDTTYASTAPAQYVVEVRAGFAEQYGIDTGARIQWRRATR